jgi:hypothetical protein
VGSPGGEGKVSCILSPSQHVSVWRGGPLRRATCCSSLSLDLHPSVVHCRLVTNQRCALIQDWVAGPRITGMGQPACDSGHLQETVSCSLCSSSHLSCQPCSCSTGASVSLDRIPSLPAGGRAFLLASQLKHEGLLPARYP